MHKRLHLHPKCRGKLLKMPSTKIEMSWSKIAKIHELDDIARLLFPGNKNHQCIFIAIFVELKYAPRQFLTSLDHLCEIYEFSPRSLETVRAKLRRFGLLDHVSRFNAAHGYREGWVFSKRFGNALNRLWNQIAAWQGRISEQHKCKDLDLIKYI